MLPTIRTTALAAAVALLAPTIAWSQGKGNARPAPEGQTGLTVGTKAPKFTLKDQDGAERSLDEFLKTGKKVALVFYRSADW